MTCPGGDTYYRLRQVALTLVDSTNPTFTTQPSGSLTDPASRAGTRSLTYAAQDVGGGVFRQRLFVDGTEVRNDIVDANGGTCGTEFYVPVPCRTAAGPGSLDFDTTTLTDGTHTLRFEVRDATDTNKVETSAWTITVDNLAPVIGSVDVTGTAREGDTLACGATPSGQTPAITYAWLQTAADGSSKTVIAGATTATYVLRTADVNHKVICRVTATDGGGTSTQESSITSGPFAGGATVAAAPAPAGSTTTPTTTTTTPTTTTPTTTSTTTTPTTTTPTAPAPSGGGSGAPGSAGAPGGDGGTGGSGGAAGTDLNTVPGVPNPAPPAAANGGGIGGGGNTGNGTPASDDARLSVRFVIGVGSHARTSTRAVAAYVQRLTVRGTLRTPAGLPITGARVYLVQKAPGAPDAAWRTGRSAFTAADGTFAIPVASGGRSRDIRVAYFPRAGSSLNRGSNVLALQVRQDATLRLSRRLLHNGGRLVFDGRVLGTVPSGGVDVRVQVQVGRSWFTFAKLVTSRAKGGRFRTSHRFTKTVRPVTYRFRILVLPRNRTSYTKGFSRHVTVRVLP